MTSVAENLIAMLMQALGITDPEAWRHETGFPKLVEIDGTTYWLKAPINPKWRPAVTDRVMGAQFVPKPANRLPGVAYLQDPSNAPDGYALRSAAGYPLTYALQGDGHPAPGFPPGVLFDGTTHLSDADVESYIAAVQARDAALSQYHPGYTGPTPFTALRDADWHYFLLHPEVWGQISGPAQDVAQAIGDAKNRLLALPWDEAGYLADPNRVFAK